MSTTQPGSVRALEADIAARRERLATTVDELARRATPQAIVSRQAASAKAALTRATRTEDGAVRVERVAAVAAVALGLVAIGVLRRRRRR